MSLGAIFYPKGTKKKPISFDSLFIPYIYKEIYFEGVYTDIINNRDDMVIIDVGANLGVVTQYLRNSAKKLYAIEPSKEHFEALKKNKEFNNWDNVEVFNLAIADKDGEMVLNQNQQNRTCHSLKIDYKQGGQKVKTMRFDTFMKQNKIKKVDFCKFDVEGAEEMILKSEGFANIADKIDAIEVEFHFPSYPDLIKLMMEKYKFKARRYESSAVIVLFFR